MELCDDMSLSIFTHTYVNEKLVTTSKVEITKIQNQSGSFVLKRKLLTSDTSFLYSKIFPVSQEGSSEPLRLFYAFTVNQIKIIQRSLESMRRQKRDFFKYRFHYWE